MTCIQVCRGCSSATFFNVRTKYITLQLVKQSCRRLLDATLCGSHRSIIKVWLLDYLNELYLQVIFSYKLGFFWLMSYTLLQLHEDFGGEVG